MSQKNLKQLVVFGTIGVLTNLTGYLIYLGITALGSPPKLTMSLMYLLGATVGYFGNRKLTFSFRGAHTTAAIRYASAHAAGYLLNLGILVLGIDYLNYPHQYVQAIAILLVGGFLYILFKYFVFPDDQT